LFSFTFRYSEASNEGFLKPSNPGRRPAGPKDGDIHEPRLASTSKAPAQLPSAPKRRRDFEIAIICAKTLEADAVEASFDHRWNSSGKARGDPNAYSTGVIGPHNVVLAHMLGMEKENATSVANNFKVSFPSIKLALVGICGGVPFVNNGQEILLGDVVISDGLIQYDFGREYDDRIRKDSVPDNPGKQNEEIRSFVAKLKGRWSRKTLHDATSEYLGFLRKELGESAAYPGADEDKLFDPKYRHKHQDPSSCADCAKCTQHTDPVCEAARKLTCEELMCDKTHLVPRHRLSTIPSDSLCERGDMDPQPVVHFGTVACGDKVMKSGQERDKIARSEGIIAFEMEGVGVWDRLPCLVIKGISDYADSHKSEKWQHYAACAAAACTKAFLEQWAVAGK
jgi:nucleoside phosphorylase